MNTEGDIVKCYGLSDWQYICRVLPSSFPQFLLDTITLFFGIDSRFLITKNRYPQYYIKLSAKKEQFNSKLYDKCDELDFPHLLISHFWVVVSSSPSHWFYIRHLKYYSREPLIAKIFQTVGSLYQTNNLFQDTVIATICTTRLLCKWVFHDRYRLQSRTTSFKVILLLFAVCYLS